MKKRFLVIFVSAMLAAVAATAAACKEKTTPPPAPSGGVELSAAALDLDVREKATLTAVAENGEPVVWSISDESVATVNGGEVVALKAGTATIFATAGDLVGECTLTVYDSGAYPVLSVDKSAVTLVKGKKASVEVSVRYKNETVEATVSYSTENAAVATFENGVITATGAGKTTVYVTAECFGEEMLREITVEVTETLPA